MQTIFCKSKMERLTIQDNPDGVASGDVCAKPLGPVCENYNNCEATMENPLLCSFLSSLNAKEEKGVCPGVDHTYHTFTFQPGAYTKTLELLHKSDSEVWGYVLDELR